MDKSDKYIQFLKSAECPDKQRALAILINQDYWLGKRPDLPPEIANFCAYLFFKNRETDKGVSEKVIYRRQLKMDAIRYMKWIESGFISDPSPNTTISAAFDVNPSTVSGWKKDLSQELPDAEIDRKKRLLFSHDINCNKSDSENQPENWIKTIMESSGRAYQNQH